MSLWQSLFWHMPPLVLAISLVYGGTRFESPPEIIREALHWLRRLFVFLGLVGILVAFISWLA